MLVKFSNIACIVVALACVASAQNQISRPLPQFYFPILGSKETFDRAAEECKLYQGYKIAGIEATNKGFLKNTVDLVQSSNGDAVWIGAYLNFSSPNRSVIHWLDGTKTIANKGPANIWCYADILSKIEEMYRRKPNVIVPIVRTKARSKCLSLYTHDIDPSKTPLEPICVMNEPRVFVKSAFGDIVMPAELKNPLVFNRTAMAFNDLHRKLNCLIMPKQGYCDAEKNENGSTFNNIFVAKNYRPLLPEFYLGFLQMTDFKTVEALCELMHSGFTSSTKGRLMEINLLNSSYRYEKNLAAVECFNQTNDNVATVDYRTNKLGANGARGSIPIPTNLYFNFTNGKYPEYVKLWSKSKDGTVQLVNDYSYATLNKTKPLNLEWCYGHPILSILLASYRTFELEAKPYMNNREHLLRVGLGGYGGLKATPCLKLAYDDLYWPGSQAWLTTCQLPLYCVGDITCKSAK